MVSYEDGAVEMTWSSVPNSSFYRVYRKTLTGKKYKQIGRTKKKTTFVDRTGKPNTLYYYRIQAVKKATRHNLRSFSKPSKARKKRCRKYPERIAYLGDSVMSGFAAYGVLGPNEANFAKVSLFIHGLNVNVLPSVYAYNPDRAYIMIGTNDCVGSKSAAVLESMADEYYMIVTSLRSYNPNIEICVLATPNTRSSRVPNVNVDTLNNMVRARVSGLGYVKFFETGSVVNDAYGQLSAAYAAGDGIHWNAAAYRAVHDQVAEFMRTW